MASNENVITKLVSLYKSFYPKHTLFSQEKGDVIIYLKKMHKKHPLLVFDGEEIQGALFLEKKNQDGDHSLWRLKHFAYLSEDAAVSLLKDAKMFLQDQSKTVKIEMSIAESEPFVPLLENNGFTKEGVLQDHYRFGETTYLYGKVLGEKEETLRGPIRNVPNDSDQNNEASSEVSLNL